MRGSICASPRTVLYRYSFSFSLFLLLFRYFFYRSQSISLIREFNVEHSLDACVATSYDQDWEEHDIDWCAVKASQNGRSKFDSARWSSVDLSKPQTSVWYPVACTIVRGLSACLAWNTVFPRHKNPSATLAKSKCFFKFINLDTKS